MKPWIILLSAIALTLCLQAITYNHISDDAFISFRYAHNLAAGKGLVFNSGEKVEGYSNLLWIVILALMEKLGLAAGPLGLLGPAKMIGMLCGLLGVGLGYVVGGQAATACGIKNRYFPLLIPAFLISVLPFHFWSVSGLETPLVVLSLLLFMSSSYTAFFAEGSKWLPVVWLMVLSLLRPEGPIFFLPFVYLLITDEKPSARGFLPLIAAFLVPCIVLLAARLLYYGDLLPNTFYAKAAGGLQLGGGFRYLVAGVKNVGPVVFVLAGLALVFWRLARYLGFVLGVFGVYLIFMLAVGGDFMVMSRFFVHVLPAIAILAALGLAGLVEIDNLPSRIGTGIIRQKIVALGLLGAFVLPPVLLYYKELAKHGRQWTVPIAEFAAPYDEVIGYINARPHKEPLVAVEQLGYFGYYTDWRLIDLHGLTDKHMSRVPGPFRGKFDIEYILERAPDYIVTNSGGPGARLQVNPYNRKLLADVEVMRRYYQALQNDWFVVFAKANTIDYGDE